MGDEEQRRLGVRGEGVLQCSDDVLGVRAFFERVDPDADTSTTSTTSTTTTSTTAVETDVTTTPAPDDAAGRRRILDFAAGDDGVWRAIVGPVEGQPCKL